MILRNKSHNPTNDENEPYQNKFAEQTMKPLGNRDRSLNAERRVSSPLKMSVQTEGSSLIKTPSAHINPREMLNGMSKNWTTEMKSNISRLSSQKMRAS